MALCSHCPVYPFSLQELTPALGPLAAVPHGQPASPCLAPIFVQCCAGARSRQCWSQGPTGTSCPQRGAEQGLESPWLCSCWCHFPPAHPALPRRSWAWRSCIVSLVLLNQ